MSQHSWIDEALSELDRTGMRRHLRLRQSPHVAGKVQIDDRQLLDFGSNDYLALSADSRLVDAVRHAAGQLGWGSGASPLISGHGVLHHRLERELANFKGTEAALLFPTGFAANVGVISATMQKGDWVFSDEKNHASIIDGCRLSGAETIIYPHRDLEFLRQAVKEKASTKGRRLVVTDSVFSMDGDLADLPGIVEIAREHQALVMVDEAHATGVFGKRGSGICELQGVENEVDIRVGTLSKALGSLGGFVAARRSMIDWIVNRARTYIFSTAQPESIAAAGLEAIKIVSEDEGPRNGLLEKSARLRQNLNQDGWDTGQSESPIIPLKIGPADRAIEIQNALWEQGLFVPAVRPPAVPVDASILRISLTTAHDDHQLNQLRDALKNELKGN